MSRYVPLQRALSAALSAFLLSLILFWFIGLGDKMRFVGLLWAAAKPSLLVGVIPWIACSIGNLRHQAAALRSEIERLKNKE